MGLVCGVSGVEARNPHPPERPDNQTTQGKRPKRAMHFCFVFKTRMGLDGPSYLQVSQKERLATQIRPSNPTNKAQRPSPPPSSPERPSKRPRRKGAKSHEK